MLDLLEMEYPKIHVESLGIRVPIGSDLIELGLLIGVN